MNIMNMQSTRTRTDCSAALGALALLLTAGVAHAGGGELPLYHVTQLDDMVETVFPGVEWPGSDAVGLNENGDLLGHASLNYDPETGSKMQAFVYTVEHGVVALPLPPGWPSNAVQDVSDRDENGEIMIVGGGVPGPYLDIAIGEAALWRYSTVTGEVLETRLLGIPAGFDDSFAVAVNNDGTVVGFSSLTGAFTNWKYDVATDVLETFDFPGRVTDMNNAGQVCGGTFRGDLFGNAEDLTDPYDPGDVMPDWAIDGGGISAGWHRIDDHGWLVGRAPTGISDGAGHLLVAIVRYADPIGWTGMPPVSHLSLPGGINDRGDFTTRTGGAYFEDMGAVYGLSSLLAPDFPDVSVYRSAEINNHRQVAGHQAHVFLLTPLGEMVIPGDVNGDVSVDLADHCAWRAAPIDLDGDGDADDDDEAWLIDRLAVFGFTIVDCNANGVDDFCDIMEGVSPDCDENGVPDECQPDCSGDGIPDACEPDCNVNGIPDPCDILEGTSDDCNGNGIPDECDQGTVSESVNVFDPPRVLIVDSTMTDDMLVIGAGTVGDVDFHLDIWYRIGYLAAVRLTHGDTTVTLIERPGHPEFSSGSGQMGYDATLDDEGTGGTVEDEGQFGGPFVQILSPPSYTPNEALSAFDGMPIAGIWTVTVTTTESSSPAHEFVSWGLTITSESVPVEPCDCPADFDGSSDVGFGDLISLLAAWGDCPPTCPQDLDGGGSVDFVDLVTMLAAWGPCG